jgi:hypothetical protein
MSDAYDRPIQPRIFIECPNHTDAEFAARWLKDAVEADRFLDLCFLENASLRDVISQLEIPSVIQFPVSAMNFLAMWLEEKFCFSIDAYHFELVRSFFLMVEMGFFTRNGDLYRMTIPGNLTIERLQDALIRLVATEGLVNIFHPEQLLVTISEQEALTRKQKVKRREYAAGDDQQQTGMGVER